jgi:NADH dehydrogenase (ubiquinone) Fe-S protein 6
MAGAVSVTEVDQETITGPAAVERSEAVIEMGVRYEAGVPSPMEGATTTFEPIVVDGLVVKTGGSALGCPVQYIKLSAWCARVQPARMRVSGHLTRD